MSDTKSLLADLKFNPIVTSNILGLAGLCCGLFWVFFQKVIRHCVFFMCLSSLCKVFVMYYEKAKPIPIVGEAAVKHRAPAPNC